MRSGLWLGAIPQMPVRAFGSVSEAGAPKNTASDTIRAIARMLGCMPSHSGSGTARGSGWRHVLSWVCSFIQKSLPPCSGERQTSHGLSAASRMKWRTAFSPLVLVPAGARGATATAEVSLPEADGLFATLTGVSSLERGGDGRGVSSSSPPQHEEKQRFMDDEDRSCSSDVRQSWRMAV